MPAGSEVGLRQRADTYVEAGVERLSKCAGHSLPHEVVGLDVDEELRKHLSPLGPRVEGADRGGTLGVGELEHREELDAGRLPQNQYMKGSSLLVLR